MEIRKVQFTGGSSYVMTLPKEWIESEKIKKNDPIGVEVQPDGTLLITKATEREPPQSVKEFPVDGTIEPAYLFRLLIGAYIAGYTTIVIWSKERFPPFVRMVVRDFTQMTIGQEVIDETETTITIKDLLNPAEMPFANTIKRMYLIVKAMHEDGMVALKTHNDVLVKEIMARDNDVDRLHWLIARQTNMILTHTGLSKKMSMTPGRTVHYYIISRIIERIGDHAERIVDNARTILAKELDPVIIAKIAKANQLSVSIFERSIVSFFNNDMKKSHKNIESVQELERLCGEIDNLVLNLETSDAIALGNIIESVRRAGEYAGDISENVINYLVEEEQFRKKSTPNG